ncbi:hypothetical protein A3K02_01115 [candidate division WS6 bacterium RIFOXYD1_FULL_33_8]|uniref:Gram-positive cocci surface proteins LPxTG domain-containing protein n=2 Tax=Candidatus Dojkabacteria TaxID=74243 RepID=A0A0G0AFB9_9BACT|nr:MAG: hypothetical protein UR32_C0003G0040 [candidate division WS6 bacterium GW2011_GWE2_33_157]KKP44379.1 MAG: hypothetical protein UR34_C0003G0005 [candidate division WS6 bacterium GW2011_GWC1_33_20]KKP46009.1 MAG: hypothetical protein UR36_C0002G0051 [candidate division WS6 bacterium GW2011_GWF1_33_233]KKP55479.1 MAG: hypothetical protein UR47_C0001G0040 [candidate division WS6 bacterium GW2011_GWB1_33_6]KKP55559.1 MAG: hypothetical protein UR45_C0001G0041 [candidate division WS6 bacterium
MKKLITAILTVSTLFLLNVSSVLADTSNPYGPYTPYEPHKPVPTGFDDTSIFYIAGLITFIVGMSILSTVKIFKAKQSL